MKSLRQFDLNLLLLLEALLTECHVSRAAERMFLSQSAMSHALNRLRQLLDDPLLVRSGNGLQPTPRAQAILPELRQAIRLIERSLEPQQEFQAATSERSFTIACTDYFEAISLPPLMQQLQQDAPGIRIEIEMISESGNRERLENREIDLIIGLDKQQTVDKQLISQPWQIQPLACLVGSTNTQLKSQLSLTQYCQQNHVLFSDLSGVTSDRIDHWLEQQHLQRMHIARTANYMAGARIVAMTDSIMTLPRQMAELFAEMLPVRLLTPPKDMPEIEMVSLHHPLYDNDPAIRWLLTRLALLRTSQSELADSTA
ncbi:LysR family transcriptional regulator [Amphritea balenae]|uniref:LysR family transcriptional regulator n=1 Tax=Amphritea balenae TaxID=452629 RepID=A0A3P1SVQ2_9GAMM|nr:LysR family transcriptional regulator [Amphritea balenae]RRD01274.1 LysR family transcriptional regulator [Amphritea balenae]GGK58522.1 LysR family transcriptional regulator [Amphritea balenae]